MATDHYTNLIENLKRIPRGNSEGANESGKNRAVDYVRNSDLSDTEKKTIISTIYKSSNPSGWYTENNGVKAAVLALEAFITENDTQAAQSNEKLTESSKTSFKAISNKSTLTHGINNKIDSEANNKASAPFNRRNLKNLVSDGKIFSVEFIKRSTGELRTMTARLGVKRHLQGGSKAYNPAQHNLLTVFDMDAKGYRSIPVEAIQRLTVGGQTFDFVGV